MGMSCLLTASVSGCKRVPEPPARMMPLLIMDGSSRPRFVRGARAGRSGAAATRVVLLEPFAIVARSHALHPLGALNVPANGLLEARLERLLRGPAELALDLAGVDGVAQVVPGPVLHVGDESEDLGLRRLRRARDRAAQT